MREWHGQFGQDHWVATRVFPGRRGGYFVDVGASHRDSGCMSNTLVLERDLGWTGLLVEGNRVLAAQLRRQRRAPVVETVVGARDGDQVRWLELVPEHVATPGHGGILHRDDERLRRFTSQQASVEPRRTRSLSSLLREHAAPPFIEFLSIDVEGAEGEVLAGLDLGAWRFGAVLVESLAATEALVRAVLAAGGYECLGRVHGDLYFVHGAQRRGDVDQDPVRAFAAFTGRASGSTA